MKKIIACVDGSGYAESVCALSAWAAERSGFKTALLHVVKPHTETNLSTNDLSGQIGFGANINLLEELSKLDEEHGKLEQKKGQSILEYAKAKLTAQGIIQTETLHRRGSLVETISEMEAEIELIIMGRHGEDTDLAATHLSSNIESVARTIHKPLLIALKDLKPINRFLIAYDGSSSTQKAIDYVISNSLFKGLECYLLKVGDKTSETESSLELAKQKLSYCGFTVHSIFINNQSVIDAITSTVIGHNIDLLVIGAYGHSKIHNLILGSTTTTLIKHSQIPLLLFK